MKKTNYQVTIGYKSVVTINVKADSEQDAKLKAVNIMNDEKRKMYSKNIHLEDDTYSADGVLNLDKTWNTL